MRPVKSLSNMELGSKNWSPNFDGYSKNISKLNYHKVTYYTVTRKFLLIESC